MSAIHESELDRLAAADPERDPARRAAFAAAAVRVRVHDQIDASTSDPATGQRRTRPTRRRVVLVAAVVGLLLATVTGGYAYLSGGGATHLTCVSEGSDEVVVINARSADPVADCLPHVDPDDPAAYSVFTDDAGTVIVAPDLQAADAVVRADLRPGSDLAIDTDALELRMALDDLVTGAHGCGDVSAVVARAEQIVADFDLSGMPVVRRQPDAPDDSCALAFVQPELAQITIVTTGRPDDDRGPSREYLQLLDVSRTIHQEVDQECLTADQARQLVTHELSGSGHDPTASTTVNIDPEVECARVYTNAYSAYEVTVFGP